MMDMDVYTHERLMVQRVEEERRQAELRRLEREARKSHQDRLFQQRSKVLAWLGSLFVSVGQRLEQAGQIQAPCAEEPAGGRA
jgi:hypothetical protein